MLKKGQKKLARQVLENVSNQYLLIYYIIKSCQ